MPTRSDNDDEKIDKPAHRKRRAKAKMRPVYTSLVLSVTDRDKQDLQRWAYEDGVPMAVIVRRLIATEREDRGE